MQVYSRSQGKLIEIPDKQFQQLTAQRTGGVSSGVPSGGAPQQAQTSNPLGSLTGGAGKNITGHSLQDHATAFNKAQQAGDTAAMKSIKANYDREFQYQKEFIQPGIKAEGKKAEEAKGDPAVMAVIDEIERQFFGEKGSKTLAFGRTGIGGRLFGTAEKLKSNIFAGGKNAGRIRAYEATRNSSLARLAKAGGDAANIAFKEQQAQGASLPTYTDTPEEAIEKLNTIRAKLRLGESKVTKGATGQVGQTKRERGEEGLGIFDPVLGNVKRPIQDIVAGITANKMQEPANQAITSAQQLMNQAANVKDPAQKLAMIKEAQSILSDVSKQQKEIASQFTRDVNQNPLWRGTKLGWQAAMAGHISGKGWNVAKNIKSGGAKGVLGKIRPTVKGKAIRTEAIDKATEAGKKIDGNKILKSLIEKAKSSKANLSKTQQKKLTTDFLEGAKNTFKNKKLTPKATKRIWDQANKGFTKAGDAGKTVEAEYNNLLREVIRGPLERAAPGFEKGTALIAKGINRGKTLSNLAYRGGQIGAVATPLLILRSLMQNRKQGDFGQ